jgi:hypothetical protein
MVFLIAEIAMQVAAIRHLGDNAQGNIAGRSADIDSLGKGFFCTDNRRFTSGGELHQPLFLKFSKKHLDLRPVSL